MNSVTAFAGTEEWIANTAGAWAMPLWPPPALLSAY
jgi:hypothetical protein